MQSTSQIISKRFSFIHGVSKKPDTRVLCLITVTIIELNYIAAIRPLLEYAYPAWHTSLNQEQSRRWENIQKRVVNIYGNGDYVASCSDYRIAPLVDRRNQLCKMFIF